MAHGRDFIEVLVEDHHEAEEAFDTIHQLARAGAPTTDLAAAAAHRDRLIADLVRHSVAEEEHLYPLLRERLGNGDAVAEHEIGQHAAAEATMKTLERMDPANVDFLATLGTLEAQVREHAGQEEADILPLLGAVLSATERRELGARLERAKRMAPTRPHPHAPDRPPWNKLLGPGVALVDRVRDAMSGRAR